MYKKLKSKKFLLTFLPVFVLLTACNKPNEKNENTEQAQNDKQLSESQEVKSQELKINHPKCVGCGKCIKIDSEHFAMIEGQRKAKVISQENLSSKTLQGAIQACPVEAISI